MSDERILPSHFIGDWEIVSDAEALDGDPEFPITEVSIGAQEVEDVGYQFRITEKGKGVRGSSFTTTYTHQNDCLINPEMGLCISFWRHPSQDHIFATKLDENGEVGRVWGARRSVLGEEDPPDITRIVWRINARKGPHAARGFVRILTAHVRDREFDRASPKIYYLFHMDDDSGTGKTCYDMLKYSSRTESFDSIFRVRSLKFWHDEHGRKHIFAMFDDRFSLPAGHFGSDSPLGGLMPFERKILRRDIKTADDPDPGGDPDVGTWGGDPG